MQRSDGYSMTGGIVQGARTYDPTSGQWLTPDAYAGDVHDPMSQKPFVWNGNNPVEWGDPTGYTVANDAPPEQNDMITKLRKASTTFETLYEGMDADKTRTYHFATLSTLTSGQGAIAVSKDGKDVYLYSSAANHGADLAGTMSHEAGHGYDLAANLFSGLDRSLGPGTRPDPQTGEKNTFEEAHAYTIERDVLGQAYGAETAENTMASQLPHWVGPQHSDGSAWSTDQMRQAACGQSSGMVGC
jgi:RHS repeat-associated protein